MWETIAKYSEITEVELEFVIIPSNSEFLPHQTWIRLSKNLLAGWFVQKSNHSNHFKFNERNEPVLGNEMNVFSNK